MPGGAGAVARRAGQLGGQHAQPGGRDAQPAGRLGGVGAAREHGGQQVGAQPPLGVGAGPLVQQPQRDDLGGVGERALPLRGERFVHGRPDGAEDLVAGPHRHGDPVDHAAVVQLDVDGLAVLVEPLEGALLVEQPQVALGHLAAQHGLDAALVGLLLPAGERQHPRRPVLDRDGRVEQRAHGVGQREQVAVRPLAGLGQVTLGEQRAHQCRHLRPGGGPGQAEHRDAGLQHGGAHALVHVDGQLDDDAGRVGYAGQQRADVGGALHPDREHHRALGHDQLVEGVVDVHARDLGVEVAR
ncbi:hypothetical protein [Nonomuraea salmonea]|uniref:hypothetical protein n=1 Tax=Nonomuraea salmonea TaxID=46181 RepID=UPI0031EF5F8F